MIRRAMELAAEHGMRFQTVHCNDRVADIFCPKCDWPLINRETVIEQYVREPYSCPHCARNAGHG